MAFYDKPLKAGFSHNSLNAQGIAHLFSDNFIFVLLSSARSLLQCSSVTDDTKNASLGQLGAHTYLSLNSVWCKYMCVCVCDIRVCISTHAYVYICTYVDIYIYLQMKLWPTW